MPTAKKPPAKSAPARATRAATRTAGARAAEPAAPKAARTKAVAPAAKAAAVAGVKEGDPAPAFSLPATGGRTVSLAAMKGKPFVLYFYPKADTPGCTTEACDFNEALTQFRGLGIDVIGVSPDKVPALEAFAGKYGLTFPLASDPDKATAQAYGAWGEKVFMGRRSIGLIRSTFLIDRDARVAKVWKNVKVAGHAAAVLEAAKAL
jgi:peroxiredoxin Q/BCP